MNHTHASNILHNVHEVLVGMGKTHFIIDGTLLGAVRDGDFIAHDTDIDVGVLFEEWTPVHVFELTHLFLKKDIVIKHQFGDWENHFEISYHRNGIKIDLFFYRKDGDFRIFHAFENGGRNMNDDVITYEYPAELIENISPMMFQNELYPAPSNPKAVLELKYGAGWIDPVKDWDWAYGPRNIRKTLS